MKNKYIQDLNTNKNTYIRYNAALSTASQSRVTYCIAGSIT